MTIKQRNRLKIIGKNRTLKAELLEAGYSLSTANKQPPSVVKARGWTDLMEEFLPDDEVLIEHQKGLHATKTINALVMVKQEDGKELVYKSDQGVIEVDDTPTRLKAVELAYKIKRKTPDNTPQGGIQINFNANGYVKER